MIVAIIQARMGSTRLPCKLMRPLCGKPMFEHEILRLKGANRIDSLIVATTNSEKDDPVADIANRCGVRCFRGDEHDVLDRYYKAAKNAHAETIVRITGDCPLHDPAVVDLVVDRFLEKGVDYTITPSNFPEGLDTEVFRFPALETSWKEAQLHAEREHVTLFIRRHPERFKVDEKWSVGDFDHHTYHWSVDTEADFQFVEHVYAHLYRGGTIFTMSDVLELVKRYPQLLEINKGGTGYEGLEKSIKADKELKKRH